MLKLLSPVSSIVRARTARSTLSSTALIGLPRDPPWMYTYAYLAGFHRERNKVVYEVLSQSQSQSIQINDKPNVWAWVAMPTTPPTCAQHFPHMHTHTHTHTHTHARIKTCSIRYHLRTTIDLLLRNKLKTNRGASDCASSTDRKQFRVGACQLRRVVKGLMEGWGELKVCE